MSMSKLRSVRAWLCAVWCVAAGAPSLAADVASNGRDGHGPQPRLVQSGQRLVLLGVTSDHHALYQDGTTVVATELKAGARKQLVGTSPPGIVSFVYTVGKVAFVWTNPDRNVPGFGVSPLTVWSAASGANKASDDSPLGTFTTSASADGRYVMYTTRGPADGSVGDIEFARTDMSQRTTLVANAPMSFPSGTCRPWGSFVGHGPRSHPVALFCEGGAATATLASWSPRGDSRRDLLAGVRTRPYFTASPDGRRFFTSLAGTATPVVVDDRGDVRRLEEGVFGAQGFFTANDDVFYFARAPGATIGELHRASLRSGAVSFVTDNHSGLLANQAGSDLIVTSPASPDGRQLAHLGVFNNAANTFEFRVVDLAKGGSRVIDSLPFCITGPTFSADSGHALYARDDGTGNCAGPLIAVGAKGHAAIGAPSLWAHEQLAGSRIAFNDNRVFDGADFFASTADLNIVDLSRPTQSLAVLAPQAYLAFFPIRRGREIAFTTGRGANGPGLYVARARALHDNDNDNDDDDDDDGE
jgi:hypothetical protein